MHVSWELVFGRDWVPHWVPLTPSYDRCSGHKKVIKWIKGKTGPSIANRGVTVQEGYFEHLERFLRVLEPIIDDLKSKGFIKLSTLFIKKHGL